MCFCSQVGGCLEQLYLGLLLLHRPCLGSSALLARQNSIRSATLPWYMREQQVLIVYERWIMLLHVKENHVGRGHVGKAVTRYTRISYAHT